MAADGKLLEALARAIDAGGLPEPTALVWHDSHVQVSVPPGGVVAWARYFGYSPATVTGRHAADGRVDRLQLTAHLVGVLLQFDERQTSSVGAGG